MNVSLGSKWEEFVEGKVARGDYQTASEVLQEGLRLLERKELLKPVSVQSMEELEKKLLEAVESLDRGEGVEADVVLQELRKTRKSRRNG